MRARAPRARESRGATFAQELSGDEQVALDGAAGAGGVPDG